MNIEAFPTGAFGTTCIILKKEGMALVIDPGAEPERIESAIGASTVVGYALTHGHYDHVLALHSVHPRHPAPVWLHPADALWAFTAKNQNPPYYVQPDPEEIPPIQHAWEEDAPFAIPPFHFNTLQLPGHSPGSVAFHFPEESLLIGGDVIFRQSMGRTDLPGGDPQELMASLRRLNELPPETRIIPGHGPETTLAQERLDNPYLKMALQGG